MRQIKDYIAIKDGKIMRLFETADDLKGVQKSIQRFGLKLDEIREVPLGSDCRSGEDLRKYTKEYKYRPLQEQLDEGLISIPETMTIHDNKIVKKTLKELIDTGVWKLEEWEYYDPETDTIKVDENRIPKPPEPTKEELLIELNSLIESAKQIEQELKEK